MLKFLDAHLGIVIKNKLYLQFVLFATKKVQVSNATRNSPQQQYEVSTLFL